MMEPKLPLLGLQEVTASRKPWIVGSVRVKNRSVPVVSTRLSRRDVWDGV